MPYRARALADADIQNTPVAAAAVPFAGTGGSVENDGAPRARADRTGARRCPDAAATISAFTDTAAQGAGLSRRRRRAARRRGGGAA